VQFEALSYERVAVDAVHIKTALAQGFPVVIGISLYESFESDAVSHTGVVPMPKLPKEQMIGGHCMYVVGYGQKPGTFTVRNSWASDWGDKGDCYFSEAYLGSPKFGSDYWIIMNRRNWRLCVGVGGARAILCSRPRCRQ
jgi:C1A family cysteine protease